MTDTPPTPPPKPSFYLNIEDWIPYLADEDISDAQKIELIETLLCIVQGFVDLHWELDTSPETSGQSLDLTEALRRAVVNLQETPKTESEEV